jgi:hypothetical protein
VVDDALGIPQILNHENICYEERLGRTSYNQAIDTVAPVSKRQG